MPLVDDRGRVFGRFNLLDLALAFILFGLIPLGYGGYLLFKVPPPHLVSVEPASIQFDSEMRVTIHGENLRPYMRVSFNNLQTRAFFFKDPTTAEVTFEGVPPGQYDVVLYDFAQERDRLSKGLTIAPPALPESKVHAAGFLTGVKVSQARIYQVGYVFPGAAKVLAVGESGPDIAQIFISDRSVQLPVEETVRVPVLLEVFCRVESTNTGLATCRSTPGPAVGPGIYINLPVPDGRQPFLVVDVHPAIKPTMIDVRMRVAGQDAAMALVRSGDEDIGIAQNVFAAGGVVTQRPTLEERVIGLRIPAFPSLVGWQYAGQTIRVGGGINFQTPRYVLAGSVEAAPPLPAEPKVP